MSYIRKRNLEFLSAIVLQFFFVTDSWSYECSRVNYDDPAAVSQVWRQSCIPFFISDQSALFQETNTASIAIQSFNRWSSATESCTSLVFQYGGYVSEGAFFDRNTPTNNKNVLTSVDSEADLERLIEQGLWPQADLVAITLTRYEPNTGEIVDADIVVNAAKFSIVEIDPDVSCGNNSDTHDLENTLVHEVGHFIGFAHVTDAEATMFANAKSCETKKRDLSMDDLGGLCSVYPAFGPIVTCSPSVTGYDATGIEAFRNQCVRYAPKEEIEGCDCSTATSVDATKSDLVHLSWTLIMFAGLFIFRRKTVS